MLRSFSSKSSTFHSFFRHRAGANDVFWNLFQSPDRRGGSSYKNVSRFSAPAQTGPGAHPASYANGCCVSFPGVKRPWRGADRAPHLAQRLKKEKSYTSPPPVRLRGLLQGELYFYHAHNFVCVPSERTDFATSPLSL